MIHAAGGTIKENNMTDRNTSEEPEKAGQKSEGTGAVPEPYRPQVKSRSQSRISWIWLLPLVAILVGGSLLVRGWLHTGPTIHVKFESAEGLEIGQTKVRYKDVVIGVVSDIRVASDRSKVIVSAELNREGSEYITQKDSRFWVVRPRLGINGVSGLGTLLSGAYISVDAPDTVESSSPVYNFDGLDKPPEVVSSRLGSRFTLVTSDLGTLEIGSPVYYRRIEVGRVIGYELGSDGKQVDVQVFIDAPNDKFVTEDTRFWNVSGINMSLQPDGFKVETGSLVSILAGGVAFDVPEHLLGSDDTKAEPDSRFVLAPDRAQAMADPDGPAFPIELHFHQSVRGLKVGAPVDFRGLELGEVFDIDMEFDKTSQRFYALVKARLYPMRFGDFYERMVQQNPDAAGHPGKAMLGPMIQHGLRGQMRPANILSGQQYVALDFFPDADPVEFDPDRKPAVIPTVAGSFDRLQQQLSSIVSKLDAFPIEQIGTELQGSLAGIRQLVQNLDKQVAPEARSMLKAANDSLNQLNKLLDSNSPMNSNIEQTMRELGNAAKSLRMLADYLQTHPTALIRGREESFPVTP